MHNNTSLLILWVKLGYYNFYISIDDNGNSAIHKTTWKLKHRYPHLKSKFLYELKVEKSLLRPLAVFQNQ